MRFDGKTASLILPTDDYTQSCTGTSGVCACFIYTAFDIPGWYQKGLDFYVYSSEYTNTCMVSSPACSTWGILTLLPDGRTAEISMVNAPTGVPMQAMWYFNYWNYLGTGRSKYLQTNTRGRLRSNTMKKMPFSLFSFHHHDNIQEMILESDEKSKTIQNYCSDVLIEKSTKGLDYIRELVKKNASDLLVLYIENFDGHVPDYKYPIIETDTGKVRFWFLSNVAIPSFDMLLYLLYKWLDPNGLIIQPSSRKRHRNTKTPSTTTRFD